MIDYETTVHFNGKDLPCTVIIYVISKRTTPWRWEIDEISTTEGCIAQVITEQELKTIYDEVRYAIASGKIDLEQD